MLFVVGVGQIGNDHSFRSAGMREFVIAQVNANMRDVSASVDPEKNQIAFCQFFFFNVLDFLVHIGRITADQKTISRLVNLVYKR
jgi:hypothetical protein